MGNLLGLQSSLQLTADWFLRSGIQETSGGVARYYRTDREANARISTEITGYAVSALAYLYRRTGDENCLAAARKSAEFLARVAWDSRLAIFPFEYPLQSDGTPAPAYFFDCGIIARGLLALHRIDGNQEWLEAAVRTGDSMATSFVDGETIHPILALPEKRPLSHGPSWSRSPGCYQLKSAMAWQDLFEITGEPRFRNWYEAALRTALDSQRSFLSGAQEQPKVMDRLHAYCYFLEALLPVLDRAECTEAARGGMEKVAALLRQIRPHFERSDVCAQLLRLRLYLAAAGVASLDRRQAAEEAGWCSSYFADDGGINIRNGFWFGRQNGQLLPFVNPVSASFSLQALDMWRLFEAGKFQGDRYELI